MHEETRVDGEDLLASARSNLWALAQAESALSLADFWSVLAELDALSDPCDRPVACWPEAIDVAGLYAAARSALDGLIDSSPDAAPFAAVRGALDREWALAPHDVTDPVID